MFATRKEDAKEIAYAFNFTVDAFGSLILFDPAYGTQIPFEKWNPYFCMM